MFYLPRQMRPGSKNRKNNGIFPAGHPFSGQTGSNPALTAAT
jgi:hypothetical protein